MSDSRKTLKIIIRKQILFLVFLRESERVEAYITHIFGYLRVTTINLLDISILHKI